MFISQISSIFICIMEPLQFITFFLKNLKFTATMTG